MTGKRSLTSDTRRVENFRSKFKANVNEYWRESSLYSHSTGHFTLRPVMLLYSIPYSLWHYARLHADAASTVALSDV